MQQQYNEDDPHEVTTMELTTKERTRPLGLSWLEDKVYDALSANNGTAVSAICSHIERTTPAYRCTESSVARTVSELARRGIAVGEKTSGGWRWRRAAEHETPVTCDEAPPARSVPMSSLTSRQRAALRAIERDQPCSAASVARAIDCPSQQIRIVLGELQSRGLVDTNGAGLWQTTN